MKWGRQGGKQRYKCKKCGVLSTANNESVKLKNELVWFRKWIIERLTYRYIIEDSGYSKSTLERKFKDYLNKAPIFQIKVHSDAHLVIDGTYFNGELCLVLYYDFDIKYCQFYRFANKESYLEIREDLENILTLGIQINSITCDGHPAILKAIRKACPDIIIQRCLVHIQREANIWLRRKPVIQGSIGLKQIVSTLHLVKTHNDRIFWTNEFKSWLDQYKSYINEQQINQDTGRKWYRHKDLRRTAIMIRKAIPNMFHYLDNPQIPNNTNSIESFFGHLKDTLSIHRGLSTSNRKSFIKWYLHFKNASRK
ncbi:MAG: transposase [Saprospiraceae bacterium]|nr:transposase [Saprospiraceae bacterium]